LHSWRHRHRSGSANTGHASSSSSNPRVVISGPLPEEPAEDVGPASPPISILEAAQLNTAIDEQIKLAVISGQQARRLSTARDDERQAAEKGGDQAKEEEMEPCCPPLPAKSTAFRLRQLERLAAGRITGGGPRQALTSADLLLQIDSLRIVLALEEAARPVEDKEEPLYTIPRLLGMGSGGLRMRPESQVSDSSLQPLDDMSYR